MCLHVDFFQGYGKPSVMHATVVIFLEFFAWGLLTSPTIEVTNRSGVNVRGTAENVNSKFYKNATFGGSECLVQSARFAWIELENGWY